MLIKDMFKKPIERDIKGVIKVGQSDDENIKQELEEYVVTRELSRHFMGFFTNYMAGLNGNTDKMGVWISGYFGSGKSHFLKILSYLLSNKKVGGKCALDYFIDDKKIIDNTVLADMKKCADMAKHTDVILFNVDSKSDQTNLQPKDAIVSVFLKAFNEMQGFCGSIPHLADLERDLTESGQYEEFQQLYQDTYEMKWTVDRHKFDFRQDKVVDILVKMNYMGETAARNWCEKAVGGYDISIEAFAKLVSDYINKKDKNHHVVFLVDEIGQYIGGDSRLMLNLQTVTEDLGTACRGKAWVVVTSQQEMDEIIEGMRQRANDFSKIQGRFDTRISLTSTNVDEVIKKRILEKNKAADQTLRVLHERNETILKNLIVFNDTVEKKLYSGEDDFVSVYPLVPYQFGLMASVLTSIRKHSSSGKSFADGARTMLAVTKEAAVKIKDKEAGELIPFSIFYDTLERYLDDSHARVIMRALDNEIINPEKSQNCFVVDVLKTLFLLKYVDDVETNSDNITSLLVSNLETKRMSLRDKTEYSLSVLIGQKLIQKHRDPQVDRDYYVFLTDEEQEINREIDGQNVETSEVTAKLAVLLFEDIFYTNDRRYKYPEHKGRYTFAYNQYVDEHQHRANLGNDIGVRVLTPNSDYDHEDETTLRMTSGQSKEVLIALPNDRSYYNELRDSMKIEKYLKTASNDGLLSKYEQIKAAKSEEMRQRASDAKVFLQDAFRNADIYVNGDKAEIGSKDVSVRLNDAFNRLVSTVYHKLPYIEVAHNYDDIRRLFEKSGQQQMELGDVKQVNSHALADVLGFISSDSRGYSKTSMKAILDRFMKAPYGFVEDDVEWIVAKLFCDENISFTVNHAPVTIANKNKDDIIDLITKKQHAEKLLIEVRETVGQPLIKTAREIMNELFGTKGVTESVDELMQVFQKRCSDEIHTIKEFEIAGQEKPYPGKSILSNGKAMLSKIVQMQTAPDLFKELSDNRDKYFDFAEDYRTVKSFFTGNQKSIFDDALDKMKIYDESKTFIVDEAVEKYVGEIKSILKMPDPFGNIPKLPGLIKQFTEAYMAVLDGMSKPIYEAIEDARQRVLNELEGKPYKDEVSGQFLELFRELKEKADRCNNVATFQNIKVEADALKMRLLNEVSKRDTPPAPPPIEHDDDDQVTPPPPVEHRKPRVKNISMKNINTSGTWRINNINELNTRIDELRKRLSDEIEEDTVLNVEF